MKRLNLITVLLMLGILCGSAQQRSALVLFVQFPDMPFTYSYPEFQGLADSLTLYFNDQFHGTHAFSFTRGPVVTLSRNHSYYGDNSSMYTDNLMYQGVMEACRAAVDSVDFSAFSNGSATEMRDLLIVVPGKSEADTSARDFFHPQYVEFSSRNTFLRLHGRNITGYALATEKDSTGRFTGIGNLAHEYSHALGLKDMYDTDYSGSGGLSPGLGRISLMDSGNTNGNGHFPAGWSAPDYYTIGAGDGVQIDTAGTYTLEPVSRGGRYFIFSGPEEGEVYLAESRVEEKWDTLIGGHGMVIYHYDRSSSDALWSDWEGRSLTAAERWSSNRVNCNPAHQCVELQAPDSLSSFFPSGSLDGFSSETEPAFRFWDGTPSPLAISGIRQSPDGLVSFNLTRPISALSVTPFQTSVIVNWLCDEGISGIDSCRVVCLKDSDTLSVRRGVHGEGRQWSSIIDGLKPGTSYRITISIMRGGKPFFSARISAGTLSQRAGMFPFIYLKGWERNDDGSFRKGSRIPLQVFNAGGAREIHWYLNGTPVAAGDDGLYTLSSSGTLKAEIFWEDGSSDIIIKEVTVK